MASAGTALGLAWLLGWASLGLALSGFGLPLASIGFNGLIGLAYRLTAFMLLHLALASPGSLAYLVYYAHHTHQLALLAHLAYHVYLV